MFPGLTVEYPFVAAHLDCPRFANLARQVPDAIFVRDDGASIVLLELGRTDALIEDHWLDRSALMDVKYCPLREALAGLTWAMVSHVTLVIGIRGRASTWHSGQRVRL